MAITSISGTGPRRPGPAPRPHSAAPVICMTSMTWPIPAPTLHDPTNWKNYTMRLQTRPERVPARYHNHFNASLAHLRQHFRIDQFGWLQIIEPHQRFQGRPRRVVRGSTFTAAPIVKTTDRKCRNSPVTSAEGTRHSLHFWCTGYGGVDGLGYAEPDTFAEILRLGLLEYGLIRVIRGLANHEACCQEQLLKGISHVRPHHLPHRTPRRRRSPLH